MNVIAIPEGGILAHVTRTLEIAKALRKRGVETLFAGVGDYLPLVEREGFSCVKLTSLGRERILEKSNQGRLDWYTPAELRDIVAEERALFRRHAPRVVLTSFRPTARISARCEGIPVVGLINGSWMKESAVPPAIPTMHPASGIFPPWFARLTQPLVKARVLRAAGKPFRTHATELGVDVGENIIDFMMGDLSLILDVPEYAPLTTLPANSCYVGPVVWDAAGEEPAWLSRLKGRDRVVYVTMGSTGNPQVLRDAAELLARRTDCVGVFSTAGLIEPPPNMPEHVIFTKYVRADAVLQHASLLICQGGNGSVYQAIMRGVPILGVPSIYDQELNMMRVRELGLGNYIPPRQYSAAELGQAIDRALADQASRRAASALKRSCARYDGPGEAASAIVELIGEAAENVKALPQRRHPGSDQAKIAEATPGE